MLGISIFAQPEKSVLMGIALITLYDEWWSASGRINGLINRLPMNLMAVLFCPLPAGIGRELLAGVPFIDDLIKVVHQ